MDLSDITRLISSLRAQTARDSITPNGLGSILQRIVDAISSMSGIDVEDEEAILQRLSAAESNASTALQAAQNAQAGAAGNVIDSFTQSQDEDEVSLSIKQHGHSAKQVVLPAASSTGAGIMTATDKSHLDTAYGKRVNLMSTPSSESTVTLTITFGDGTTKSVTFVGATAGTGGKAGLMTKEQADQLAALVAAGAAENVRDDAGYLKQQYAAPVILRNVSDETVDDLSVGDIFYDAGKLWQCGTTENTDMGAPSKNLVYFCLAENSFYRWTGSSFTQITTSGGGASEILALNGVSSNQDGTIIFTDTAGNTYTVNLNHTHENMAKLIVCEESDLPSTLDPATIYAITDSGETEIEKLIIRGMEFAGGGIPDTGMPQVTKPSTLRSLNLGTNTGSGVAALVDVKARNLNYNGSTDGLTVSVGQNSGLLLSYGQTSDATSITIPQLDAETGCQITVKYTGSGALDDGALVFSHDNAVLASVVVVVVERYVTDGLVFHLDGADASVSQWVDRIGGIAFAMNNVTLDGNGGVVFNGTNSYGIYSAASSLGFTPTTHTIEVVANIGGSATALIFMQNKDGDLAVGLTGSGNLIFAVQTNEEGTTPQRKVTGVSRGLMTMSLGDSLAYINKVSKTVTNQGCFDQTSGAGVLIGARDTTRSFLQGTIYQIRVYNRILTSAEIQANQQADIERYNIQ